MKSLVQLLSDLRSLDVILSLDGERLNVNAPRGILTPDLKSELALRKEEISAFLRQSADAQGVRPSTIERIESGSDLPVSFCQQRLWFLNQLEPNSAAYNIAAAFRLKGHLDFAGLKNGLGEITRRHESLRTRFATVEGAPKVIVDSAPTWKLERVDLSHLPPARREEEVLRGATAAARQPFDLARGPLFRAVLWKLDATTHALFLAMHHIISDGWSLGVFVRELTELYTASVTNRKAHLPNLPVQYSDFAKWQRHWLDGGIRDAQLPYWKEHLGGSLPVLQLPSSRPRPKLPSFHGGRVTSIFPAALADDLKALGRDEGATFFMVLLAGFQVLLHRYTGEEDMIVGSPTANRSRAEIENVIGFFVNNLVLRTDVSGNPTVRELLARTREVALEAYAHQDVPFDELVEVLKPRRALDHSPLFQVMFSFQNLPIPDIDLPGLTLSPIDIETNTARFDLSVDIAERKEGLKLHFEYNLDVLDSATIERMPEHFRGLLEGFVRKPDARIADLPMLTEMARRQPIGTGHGASAAYPKDKCVHVLFEEQVARSPDAVAVTCEGNCLTYRELNERANRLARQLKKHGIGPDALVGVWVERSLDMVVAVLGALKAGGAYVPLDPSFPIERIEFMIHDSQLHVLLTQEKFTARLSGKAAACVLRMDADWPPIACEAADDLPSSAKPENLAYVIYTSGSTGKPKGVEIEHRSVVNFLVSMREEPGLTATDRLVSVTTLSFDIAGLEIYGPLTVGGHVIIASRSTALDGVALAALLEQSHATVMQATPATWRLIFEAGWRGLPSLKVLCGGEALSRELADKLLATGAEVWNLYGPTETTIWSTVGRVEPGDSYPDIGHPIANTAVYIRDSQRRPVPFGVPGEIYIGGDGLARAYLNRPELTSERFVADPFSDASAARMYATGDLGRYREDGTIQCLGRIDQQVKIHGFRIELGEVETAITNAPGISRAVVVARDDASGVKNLVAYIVPQSNMEFDASALRAHLAKTLPEYTIPSAFVALESFPLTPNAKIDKQRLPEPSSQRTLRSSTYAAPSTEAERAIAEIWQEVLKLEKVGLHDNFFDIGGHSLLVVQVQNRLGKRMNRTIAVVELFEHPTISSLADFLSNTNGEEESFAGVLERPSKRNETLRGTNSPS